MQEIAGYALHISIIISALFYLHKNFVYGFRSLFWPGVAFKMVATVAFGSLYLYYFKAGDTLGYYSEGVKLSSLAAHDFNAYLRLLLFDATDPALGLAYSAELSPRAYWVVKVASVILLMTGNNYWISSLYLSTLSFLGTFYLAESLLKIYPENKTEISIAFLFLPSFIFWSSGLSKESLAIAGLFYLFGLYVRVLEGVRIRRIDIPIAILAFWVLYKIRFFYLAAALITYGICAIFYFARKVKIPTLAKIPLGALMTALLLIGIFNLDFTLRPHEFLRYLYYSYYDNFQSNPSNTISYYHFEPTLQSALINAPIALVSGLFRPLPFDLTKVILLPVALENLGLIIIFLVKIPHFRKTKSGWELATWAYIFLLAIFLSLSTPNFGSLTRYKVAFQPLFLFLILKDNEWVGKMFNYLKSKVFKVRQVPH